MKQLLLAPVFIFFVLLLNAQATSTYQFNAEQTVFTENKGQVVDMDGKPVPDVLAKASMPGLDMYLTKTGVTYVLLQYTEDFAAKPHVVFINDKKFKVTYSRVDVALTGATINNAQMQFTGEAGWKSNYYKTADAKGQLAVSHFTNMTVQNVYPCIDWVWKFNAKGNLEYAFVVHPGADPALIKMQYSYADLKAGKNELVIGTRIGSITEGPLLASNAGGGVAVNYNVSADKLISFAPAAYDKTKDLVIDPPLALNWSAQFGGAFLNGLRGVTTDNSGGVYLVGYTTSSDFPTFQYIDIYNFPSYLDSTFNGQSDAVLLKLDTLQNLKWATYLGGPGNDFANSACIAFYNNGNIGDLIVTGGAQTGFPVDHSPYTCTGQDAFVSMFSLVDLQMEFSGFYGGNGTDEGLAVCSTAQGFAIAGYTNSTNNSFASFSYNNGQVRDSVTGQEAFITDFGYPYNNLAPMWNTKFGGSGDDYATAIVESSLYGLKVIGFTSSTDINMLHGVGYYQGNNAGGVDGFLLSIDDRSGTFDRSTYYGGTGNDYFTSIAGSGGNTLLTGRTNSVNFPTDSIAGLGYNQTHLADSSYDALIVMLSIYDSVRWATYYGGRGDDAGTGITADNAGKIYLTGFTFSNNFPVQSFPGSFNQSTNHGNADGFLARFSMHGLRSWSTYKGDSCYQYPNGIAYDTVFNKFYVAGEGMLACGQSLPDTGQVNNGISSVGFCWSFNGQNAQPSNCVSVNLKDSVKPCPNQCNGVAIAEASGEFAPYHYYWSTGSTSIIDSNLCGGPGWVQVSDSAGCSQEVVFQMSPLSAYLGYEAVSCSTNLLEAVVSNGNPSYLYQWSTTPGYTDIDTLYYGLGSINVTVMDANSCTVLISYSETSYNTSYFASPISISYYPSCIDTTTSVSIGNYYSWYFASLPEWTWPDGHQTTGDYIGWGSYYNTYAQIGMVEATPPGTFYTIIDSGECVNGNRYVMHYKFALPEILPYLQVSAVPPSSCIYNDGSITIGSDYQPTCLITDSIGDSLTTESITVYGGYDGLSYRWSNGVETSGVLTNLYSWQSSFAIYNLASGNYTITVTDGNCDSIILYTSLNVGQLQIVPVVDTPACRPATISAANINGDTGPFTYLWSNGASGDSITGLTSGRYTVQVVAPDGCSVSDTFNVTVRAIISATMQGTGIACTPGSVTVLPTGGTGPFSYQWSTSSGFGDSTTIFVMDTGVYSVIVKDSTGCMDTAYANISYNNLPVQYYDITVEQYPSCGVKNGVIYFSNPDYSKVSWLADNGEVTYGDTITDAYTSTWWNEFVITDSSNCLNGIVTPVQYSIYLFSAFGYDQPAFLTVYDYPNGCNTEDGEVNTEINTQWAFNTSINGQQTTDGGSFAVLNYQQVTYSWSNGANYQLYDNNWLGDSVPFGLSAGIYTVTVTDGVCSLTSTINLAASNPPLIANYSITPSLCNDDTNGKIDLLSLLNNVSSQNQWLADTNTYVWSNGATTQSISNLGSGTYTVTINGPNACPVIDTFFVAQPIPLVVTDTVTSSALCYGGVGIVHIIATGGTAPYYGAGIIAEPAGDYVLVITDNNGCADSVSVTISQPTKVSIAIQWLDTIIPCRDSVKVAISATGGNGLYTGTGNVVYTHSGNYTVVVSDGNGCTADSVMSIHLDTCVDVKFIVDNMDVSVYPNPATDKFYVKFMTGLTGAADVRLYAVDGKLVMLKTLNTGTDIAEMDCNRLACGVYVLRTIVESKEYNFKIVVTR